MGNVFSPNDNFPWMKSHAANPFVVEINNDISTIYFTCRDESNRSHIGSVEIDFSDNFNIINVPDMPILAPGEAGIFDDSGVAMGYHLTINDKKHLYYLGWNLKVTVPWLNTIGLAIYNEEKKIYEKVSRAPIMDRSNEDPFTISYPSILEEDNKFRMWYGSNQKWGSDQSEMNHVFKYAESRDGLNWNRTNIVVVDLQHKNEYALSKPFVLKEGGIYKMWYSYRANGEITTYRIGYAESNDGIIWDRKDTHVGIDVSSKGWDSEMICYPYVFEHKNTMYMLYNGNEYGGTGFGIAVLKK